MKKTFYYVFMMLFAASLALGCGGKGEEGAKTEGGENKEAAASSSKAPKDLIARVWHVDADKMEVPASAKPEQIEKMKEALKSVTMEFKADGTCSFNGMGDQARTGKWKVSDDGKNLTITDDKLGKDETNAIISLTDTEFVMDSKGGKIHLKP